MTTKKRLQSSNNTNSYGFPLLPYLDPEFNPDHPVHHLPPVDDEYFPLGPRLRQQLLDEALSIALAEWTPPHVPRSWETNPDQARHRDRLLNMILYPRQDLEHFDLMPPEKIHDSSITRQLNKQLKTRDPFDFRNFAALHLHLGYNRFHAYGSLPEETALPSGHTVDPPDSPSTPLKAINEPPAPNPNEPPAPNPNEPPAPNPNEPPAPNPNEVCWIMEYTEPECSTIRRRLAHGMGLFPAVIDPKNDLYDDEIASRYARRLYVRCRRRNKQCIRPSHIEIFTSSFRLLP